MKVILLFEPDAEFCKPDPLDILQAPRPHFLEIPAGADVVTIWREWNEAYEGGYTDHVFSTGIFENVTSDQTDAMIAAAEPQLE